MKPLPSILRHNPSTLALPVVEAAAKQRLKHSRFNLAMGSLKLSTQGLVDYLSYMIQKTW